MQNGQISQANELNDEDDSEEQDEELVDKAQNAKTKSKNRISAKSS